MGIGKYSGEMAVVITVAPALLCAPAGWLVARLSGADVWLHVQDFEIDVAFRLGLLKSDIAAMRQQGGTAVEALRHARQWASGHRDCAPGTELAAVVSQCGLTTPPENPERLATTIVTLADDPALMAELRKRARAWAEAHFERDAILGKMFASLHDKKSRAAATAAPLPSPDDQVMTISE